MTALRKLPYIPLYVNDFSCDEKLRMCSASAVGVYIFLMCVLHKSTTYGALTLQRFRKNNKTSNKTITTQESLLYEFAELLRRQTPFLVEEIKDALEELVFYKVVVIEGKTLYQPRMKKDGEKSEKRGRAGKAGMQSRWSGEAEENKTNNKNITKPITKPITKDETNALQNTEYEYEYEYNIDSEEIGVQGERKRTAFEPPAIEEIKAYILEKGYSFDAESFFDFYESKGWFVGKNKMKDWKAAVRNWHRGEIERRPTGARPKTTSKNANEEWK